jgi:putative transposase
MGNTYGKLYLQTVFAVKYREARILPAFRSELFAVIGNLINETGAKTLIVNGVEDHVHCFFSIKPSQSVSDVMQVAKAKSSKWLNESGYLKERFEWQRGFGVFSYHPSLVETVVRYIQNQEEHHRKQTFREEYIEFLERFEVDYDPRYLFDELI